MLLITSAAIINPLQSLRELLRRDTTAPAPLPPQHDLADQLRAEFQASMAEEREARLQLARELEQERSHGKAQARTITLMESTVGSLQRGAERATAELVNLTSALAVANQRYDDLRQEYQQTQVTNTAARNRLHERVAQLETVVEQLTSENAGNANRAQVAEAKVMWYAEENVMLREAYLAAGGDLSLIDTRMAERGRRVLS